VIASTTLIAMRRGQPWASTAIRRGLREAGIALNAELELLEGLANAGWLQTWLVNYWPEPGQTPCFALGPRIAVGAATALRELGLACPEKILPWSVSMISAWGPTRSVYDRGPGT